MNLEEPAPPEKAYVESSAFPKTHRERTGHGEFKADVREARGRPRPRAMLGRTSMTFFLTVRCPETFKMPTVVTALQKEELYVAVPGLR